MKDKFIVVDCMGIKQVGFDGAMGVSTLDVEQIVEMMNGFNNTCERLEKHIKGTAKALEVCGERIEVLENELKDVKARNNHLVLTMLECI